MTAPTRLAAHRPTAVRPPRPGLALAAAIATLVVVYAAVIALGDSRAGSGSDAGGKLATAVQMAEHDTLQPDVGYWAEGADPDGTHHPLWNSVAVGDTWIQATSLPFEIALVPLWRLGGIGGVLVLSITGGVLAAVGAKRIAAHLGAGDGWAAFWLVGASGPALFYAGDVWEHGLALGLALLAVALALETDSRGRALLVGLLAGAAVVLRAEMLLYGIAFVGATLVVREERQRWLRRPRVLLTVVAGAAVPILLNGVVERLLIDHGVRDDRAANTLSSAAAGFGQRATDALVTSVGMFPSDEPMALLLGAAAVGCVGLVAAHLVWPEKVAASTGRTAAIAALLLYGLRLTTGLGFMPGFLVVAPLALLGGMAVRTAEERVLVGTALGAVPLVWATAWTGNHVAQWGGRYLLLSGAILTILGVVAASRLGWRTPAVVFLAGLTVLTGIAAAGWHIERTRIVGEAVAQIEDRPIDTVVVTDQAHLGREGGYWYGHHRWLWAGLDGDLDDAVELAADQGATSIAVVQRIEGDTAGAQVPDPPAAVSGFRQVDEERIPWLVGEELLVRDYEVG